MRVRIAPNAKMRLNRGDPPNLPLWGDEVGTVVRWPCKPQQGMLRVRRDTPHYPDGRNLLDVAWISVEDLSPLGAIECLAELVAGPTPPELPNPYQPHPW